MLSVFIPMPGRPVRALFDAGAAIVGELSDAERVLVHYEPRTPAMNIKTFADRCYHAADRLTHHAATSKMCAPAREGLFDVGVFDLAEGRVLLHHGAESAVADWLGQATLDLSELVCEGTEHYARNRELLSAARSPNPGLAMWARAQARRRGIA